MSKEVAEHQYISGASDVVSDRSAVADHSEYWQINKRNDPVLHWKVDDRSVGWIYSPLWKGTGFRVGDDFIITADHVFRKIIAEMSGIENILKNERVYIQFDHNVQFQFHKICYRSQSTDITVVQLYNPKMVVLPKPLPLFRQDYDIEQLTFVAFNEDGNKEVEENCPSTIPNLKDQVQICSEKLKKMGFDDDEPYDDLVDKRLVPVRTKFRHGASGAPGIVQKDGQDKVYAVLIKGYPRFFWKLSPEMQEKIPPTYIIQAAVKLSALYKEMLTNTDPGIRAVGGHIFSTESNHGFFKKQRQIPPTKYQQLHFNRPTRLVLAATCKASTQSRISPKNSGLKFFVKASLQWL